jgi:hypothetical protein
MSAQLDKLFTNLVLINQSFMPNLSREINNGHPTANTKDRLRDMHGVLSAVLQYMILSDAEKRNIDVNQAAAAPPHDNQAPALLAAQHFPATGQVALGAPPMQRQVISTIVDGSLALPGAGQAPINVIAGGAGLAEVDPEPADVVQIITRKDGSTVVIPPRGYNVPARTFSAGQSVDATFYLPQPTA